MAKKEATELFGNEKDESFKSSLQSIVQTFGGQFLYPSIEEQAANLLYFATNKNSSASFVITCGINSGVVLFSGKISRS
ncbi:MAG: hypothetical protein GW809_01575, partial [Bacteroidetes bacterium]|nr:hypothetical protein [Bacteroidota bacterium]